MSLYSAAELQRWIDDIDQRTLDRVSAIAARLAAAPELRAAVLAREDGRERIFAALATGEFEYLRDRDPDWSSWIEGDPPYLLLMMKNGVVVDLVAPKNGLAGFLSTYGCTPRQLAMLARHRPNERPGPMLVNLRDDDIGTYLEDPEGRALIGPVLAVSREFPDRFYRLQHIRNAAFRLFGVDYAQAAEVGRMLVEGYARPSSFGIPIEHLQLVTRAGTWPNSAQIAHRLGYYLVARDLWGDEARDPMLDAWIGDADQPIDFSPMDPTTLALHLSRLYVRHHVFTAPLTGGLGGGYTLRAREANAIFQIFSRVEAANDPVVLQQVATRRDNSGRVGIASWMFEQIIGRDDTAAGQMHYPLRRFPEDEEWAQFLGRVDRNRMNLIARDNAQVRALERALELLEPRLRANSLSPAEEAALVRQAVVTGSRSGVRGINFLCAGADLADQAGPSAGSIGLVCKSVVTAMKMCAKFAEATPALDIVRERMCGWVDGLCRRRTAGMTITRFHGMLDKAPRAS